MRSYPGDGQNKAAYETIQCELAARNWCTVSCKARGVEDLPKKEGGIFPNPVNAVLHLSGVPPVASWSLYNADGSFLLSGYDKDIDLSAFPPGFYLLDIEYTGGERIRKKIIKQ